MLFLAILFLLTIVLFSCWRLNKHNKILPVVGSVVISIFLIELCCYIYLVMLSFGGGNFFLVGNQWVLDQIIKYRVTQKIERANTRPDSTYVLDNNLGWTVAPNRTYKGEPAINSQGIRSLKEFSLVPDPNKLRVVALGDSFMFCDGETTDNCWSEMIQQNINNLEVLNFGISGYGLGQSFLRYVRDAMKFRPDVIMINYLLPTHRDNVRGDIVFGGEPLTNANLYRVRFGLEDGQLTQTITTVDDWFDHDFREKYVYGSLGISEKDSFWSNPIFSWSNIGLLLKQKLAVQHYLALSDGPQFDPDVNFKILTNFLRVTVGQGVSVIFLIHIPFEQLPPHYQALLTQFKQWVTCVYTAPLLMKRALEDGVTDRKELLNKTAHFDAHGNRIHADVFGDILTSRPWGSRDRIFQYDPTANSFINTATQFNQ